MYALLSQRRLWWLGHVRRMEDGRIPKDVFYGQLASGSRRVGRPALRYKDACKRDMKACNIDTTDWEIVADDRSRWRQKVKNGIKQADKARGLKAAEKRARRKLSAATAPSTTSRFTCSTCSRVCHSLIGLRSHSRCCSSTKEWQSRAHRHRLLRLASPTTTNPFLPS